MTPIIRALDPNDPEARHLLDLSDEYMARLYPAESNHGESVEGLLADNAIFVGAFLGETLVGCGAVKRVSGDIAYGEIKRVFVPEEHRGKGISKAIMRALEDHLLENGIAVARLETGIEQPEAIGLYEKLGYFERPPFGDYREDPLSLFMEKKLGSGS